MKYLIFSISLLMISLIPCRSQNSEYNTESEFCLSARKIVSEGNHQYDRSSRKGIKQMADSLEKALRHYSILGKLNSTDSLEFTADLLKLRADWHYENGNYDDKSYHEAESLFRQALEIYQSNPMLSGPRNRLPMIQREMAQLMYKTCRYDEALAFTTEALNAFKCDYDNGEFSHNDEDYISMLDLQSQQAMCMARLGKTDEAIKQIDNLINLFPKTSENYFELLRKKGKIIMLSEKINCKKIAAKYYEKYLNWRKADAIKNLGTMTSSERQDYWMRIRPFIADCYQLEDENPTLLYNVTLFSKGILLQLNKLSGHGIASATALKSLNHTWIQIQDKLATKACAIEFIQYTKNNRQLMGALVLKKTGTPQWVQMMSPNDFNEYEIGVWKNKERLYTTDGNRKNQLYNDSTLQHLIWNSKLLNIIGKSNKVYFAPDGYYHQLAVEYMLPKCMENIELYRLTSTRRLLEPSKECTDSALLIGGIRYDNDKEETRLKGNDIDAYSYIHNIHAQFEYLTGSLSECDSIRVIRSSQKDKVLTGYIATEQSFKSLCNKYPLISISTHGYFGAAQIPQSTDIKTSMTDESMSQCMIIMAGANTNVNSDKFDPTSMDGILSAKEIAKCDLSRVNLIVLSACQTGLGYITSDGVFGIQRGLKNAGAGSLLVSLWNVDDCATCILMSQFHKNIHDGMTIHKAFMSARDSLSAGNSVIEHNGKVFNSHKMATEIIDDNSYADPQFRNAFILIDAIE